MLILGVVIPIVVGNKVCWGIKGSLLMVVEFAVFSFWVGNWELD